MKRYFYIAGGSISLIIGLLGIVTPGVPTTPFLLLTGFLYAKGSPRLHQKLLDNPLTGYYLKRLDSGLNMKIRLCSIAFMWLMVSITAFLIFDYGTKRVIMISLGLIGTVAQLIVLARKRKKLLLLQQENVSVDRAVLKEHSAK